MRSSVSIRKMLGFNMYNGFMCFSALPGKLSQLSTTSIFKSKLKTFITVFVFYSIRRLTIDLISFQRKIVTFLVTGARPELRLVRTAVGQAWSSNSLALNERRVHVELVYFVRYT